jgi:hypothetical protein
MLEDEELELLLWEGECDIFESPVVGVAYSSLLWSADGCHRAMRFGHRFVSLTYYPFDREKI